MKKKSIIILISAVVVIGGIVAGVFALKPSTDAEQPETIESTVEPTVEPATISADKGIMNEYDTTIEDENASDITTESNGGSISTEYETAPSVETETEAPSTQTEQNQPSSGSGGSGQNIPLKDKEVINDKYEPGSMASKMTDEQISAYIEKAKARGWSDEKISEKLYNTGTGLDIGGQDVTGTADRDPSTYTDEELEALKGAIGKQTH